MRGGWGACRALQDSSLNLALSLARGRRSKNTHDQKGCGVGYARVSDIMRAAAYVLPPPGARSIRWGGLVQRKRKSCSVWLVQKCARACAGVVAVVWYFFLCALARVCVCVFAGGRGNGYRALAAFVVREKICLHNGQRKR